MINKNELRYGSIISTSEGSGQIENIYHKSADVSYNTLNGNRLIIQSEFHEMQHIVCTPYWLELLGFEKDGFGGFNINISHWVDRLKIISFSGDYIYLREGDKNKKRHDDDLVVLWNNDLRGKIPVHQLQSIYFILSGKELVIHASSSSTDPHFGR